MGSEVVFVKEVTMRLIGLRLPILAMIVLASSLVPGRADEVLYLETVDWVPTASVLALPTAYVVPSSYVVPRLRLPTCSRRLMRRLT